ncbi:alpha-L-fucosidase [Pullulanibacillus pueri]|uniref:alpha-L-fucosidase n=1 Tax=Pullulanibacillus pueri TaxID=1437324 RepID=A0A8J3EMN2_9BACL|nr:alpha-L-fucosidase [Pullulanibacillus pueri]MBM7680921.1 alpha-L-fucosidase [Pullulanibacillus pueri]GGH81342.1 alpha-L-fucosidase [Pullulanibacillus pueri]
MAGQNEEQIIEQGVHNYSAEKEWVKPEDPLLLERLEWFKDQKLGIMMHWGPYSQLGIVESWALSDKDGDWSREGIDWERDSEELKRQYFDLNKTFNPIRFQPEVWADLAYEGGFKYLIFTTKHHDGFSMWDTHMTDYRITGQDTPFHKHKYADICKHLFDAFRARGLSIATYFSKADWHSEYYWAQGMERGRSMWRGPSYDPEEYPWLWESFVQFTHEQIMELMSRYGRIDVLWLDAGWVGHKRQDICLGEVIQKARKLQPWLITADRTMGGPYENYITPEQTIPEHPLSVPWESCITMGTSFSFKYEDDYKTAREIIHTLVEVIAKGGNLALNVGPQPDGRLPSGAISRMKELGAWLNIYGEAVYGTRICAPYFKENCGFTCKGETVYCFYLYQKEDVVKEYILLPFTGEVEHILMLGKEEIEVSYQQINEGVRIRLPHIEEQAPIAHVFKIE